VITLPPCWRIVAAPGEPVHGAIDLVCEPGVGWGTGAHPTTQLCLQAVAAFAPRLRPWRMLDFGAGSGLLAIAAAKLGAHVLAVEIDERGLQHGARNARTNHVEDRIQFSNVLDPRSGLFDVVAANILRRVLVQHASPLTSVLSPGGAMILSGLVSTDVPEVHAAFSACLGGRRAQVHERQEWRAVCFWPAAG
jgi:ribosomal protein L11 methyltransferase